MCHQWATALCILGSTVSGSFQVLQAELGISGELTIGGRHIHTLDSRPGLKFMANTITYLMNMPTVSGLLRRIAGLTCRFWIMPYYNRVIRLGRRSHLTESQTLSVTHGSNHHILTIPWHFWVPLLIWAQSEKKHFFEFLDHSIQ